MKYFVSKETSNTDEDDKEIMYELYTIKALTMQRDNFTCQHKNCPYCHNIITLSIIHHTLINLKPDPDIR